MKNVLGIPVLELTSIASTPVVTSRLLDDGKGLLPPVLLRGYGVLKTALDQ